MRGPLLSVKCIRYIPFKEERKIYVFLWIILLIISETKIKNSVDHSLQSLELYSWPGNVRELQNTLQLIPIL